MRRKKLKIKKGKGKKKSAELAGYEPLTLSLRRKRTNE